MAAYSVPARKTGFAVARARDFSDAEIAMNSSLRSIRPPCRAVVDTARAVCAPWLIMEAPKVLLSEEYQTEELPAVACFRSVKFAKETCAVPAELACGAYHGGQ
jgi:hypothetical protein